MDVEKTDLTDKRQKGLDAGRRSRLYLRHCAITAKSTIFFLQMMGQIL
jgi:hypothetical protein